MTKQVVAAQDWLRTAFWACQILEADLAPVEVFKQQFSNYFLHLNDITFT